MPRAASLFYTETKEAQGNFPASFLPAGSCAHAKASACRRSRFEQDSSEVEKRSVPCFKHVQERLSKYLSMIHNQPGAPIESPTECARLGCDALVGLLPCILYGQAFASLKLAKFFLFLVTIDNHQLQDTSVLASALAEPAAAALPVISPVKGSTLCRSAKFL